MEQQIVDRVPSDELGVGEFSIESNSARNLVVLLSAWLFCIPKPTAVHLASL